MEVCEWKRALPVEAFCNHVIELSVNAAVKQLNRQSSFRSVSVETNSGPLLQYCTVYSLYLTEYFRGGTKQRSFKNSTVSSAYRVTSP